MSLSCSGSRGTVHALRWDMSKYFYFNSNVFVFMVSFNLAHSIVAFNSMTDAQFLWVKGEKFKGKYVLHNNSDCMWLTIKIEKVTHRWLEIETHCLKSDCLSKEPYEQTVARIVWQDSPAFGSGSLPISESPVTGKPRIDLLINYILLDLLIVSSMCMDN